MKIYFLKHESKNTGPYVTKITMDAQEARDWEDTVYAQMRAAGVNFLMDEFCNRYFVETFDLPEAFVDALVDRVAARLKVL